MIFRAIFWVGFVALLMPHEPDLGLGRPASLDSNVTGEVASWTKATLQPSLAHPSNLCRYNIDACVKGVSLLDNVKSAAVRGLDDVRADIEQNGRNHKDKGD
jgi:hypothetical protein